MVKSEKGEPREKKKKEKKKDQRRKGGEKINARHLSVVMKESRKLRGNESTSGDTLANSFYEGNRSPTKQERRGKKSEKRAKRERFRFERINRNRVHKVGGTFCETQHWGNNPWKEIDYIKYMSKERGREPKRGLKKKREYESEKQEGWGKTSVGRQGMEKRRFRIGDRTLEKVPPEVNEKAEKNGEPTKRTTDRRSQKTDCPKPISDSLQPPTL